MYLFINSAQSNLTFPANRPYSFTVDINQQLEFLQGDWVCGLRELRFQRPGDLEGIFLISTDTIQSSHVHGIYQPALTIFPVEARKRRASFTDHIIYDNPYYIPLVRGNGNQIHFEIKTLSSHNNLQLNFQKVWLVLEYKPASK